MQAIETPQEWRAFLNDLCTPKELQAMQERWHIAQLLIANRLTYREIHQKTGASLTTITRVARFLHQEQNHGYKMLLEKLNIGMPNDKDSH